MNKSILEKSIQDEADWLVNKLKEMSREIGSNSGGYDPTNPIVKAVNNIISCMVFGSKCSVDAQFEEKMARVDVFFTVAFAAYPSPQLV